jgi:type 1 fimbriae regulatory protein FimB/type 1 fimbriae regulatory protein FimE
MIPGEDSAMTGDRTAAAEPHQHQKTGKMPRRRPNEELRSREYLTEAEVERLIKAAGKLGRHGHRDAALILLAYRHALRVSEVVALRWDAVDLEQGYLHVARVKNGRPSTHPLVGREIRALRRLRREYPSSPKRAGFPASSQAPLSGPSQYLSGPD